MSPQLKYQTSQLAQQKQTMITSPLPTYEINHVLDHTADLWRLLSGERLFITGGTGFFGSWMLESLITACSRLNVDLKATVLTRNVANVARSLPHLYSHPSLTWIEGDIRNFKKPTGTFSQIIHLASEVSHETPAAILNSQFESIVLGTRRVLDFAVQARATNLLLTSSGAIYGQQPASLLGIREDAPYYTEPTHTGSTYSECKRMAETLCISQGTLHGIQPKIARCFSFAGPRLPLDSRFALSDFILEALNHNRITILSNGASRRSYLHVADLTIWLLHILTRGTTGRTYNVGSEHAISMTDLARRIALQISNTIKISTLGSRPSEADRPNYIPCCARARHELGLEEFIPFDRTLISTIEWHRSSQSR